MRVRVKGGLFRRFRRVGITFTREWQEVDPAKLGPEKLDFLTGPESEAFLEIEGAPPRKAPAPAPAQNIPPTPPQNQNKAIDDDDGEDDAIPAPPARPVPPRPPIKGK